MTINSFKELMMSNFTAYPGRLILNYNYREDGGEYTAEEMFDFAECKKAIEEFGNRDVKYFVYDGDQDRLYVKLGDE